MYADLIWHLRLYCGKVLSGLVKPHTLRLPNFWVSVHIESQLSAALFLFLLLPLAISLLCALKKAALPLRIFQAFLLCKIRQPPLYSLTRGKRPPF